MSWIEPSSVGPAGQFSSLSSPGTESINSQQLSFWLGRNRTNSSAESPSPWNVNTVESIQEEVEYDNVTAPSEFSINTQRRPKHLTGDSIDAENNVRQQNIDIKMGELKNSVVTPQSKSYLNAMAALQKRVKCLEADNISMQLSLKKDAQQLSNSAVAGLRFRQENSSLKGMVDKTNQQFEQLEKQLQSLRPQLARYRGELDEQRRTTKVIEKTNKSLKAELQKLKATNFTLSDQLKTSSQNYNHLKNHQVPALLRQVELLSKEKQQLQAIREQSTTTLLEKYAKSVELNEILETKVKRLSDDLSRAQGEKAKVLDGSKGLRQQCDHLLKQLKLEEQQNTKVSEELKIIKEELTQAHHRTQRITLQCESFKSENGYKQKQIERLSAQVIQLHKEESRLQKVINELRLHEKEELINKGKLKETLKELEDAISKLKQQESEMKTEITSLRHQNASLASELNSSFEKCQLLNGQLLGVEMLAEKLQYKQHSCDTNGVQRKPSDICKEAKQQSSYERRQQQTTNNYDRQLVRDFGREQVGSENEFLQSTGQYCEPNSNDIFKSQSRNSRSIRINNKNAKNISTNSECNNSKLNPLPLSHEPLSAIMRSPAALRINTKLNPNSRKNSFTAHSNESRKYRSKEVSAESRSKSRKRSKSNDLSKGQVFALTDHQQNHREEQTETKFIASRLMPFVQQSNNMSQPQGIQRALLVALQEEALRLYDEQQQLLRVDLQSSSWTQRAEQIGRLKQLGEQIRVNTDRIITIKNQINK